MRTRARPRDRRARAESAPRSPRRSPRDGWPVRHRLPQRRPSAAQAVNAEIEAPGGVATTLQARHLRARRAPTARRRARRSSARCWCSSTTPASPPTASRRRSTDERLGHASSTRTSPAAFRLTRRGAAADDPRPLRPHRQHRLDRRHQRPTPARPTTPPRRPGLIGMTQTVAAEVARRGVTVNAVAPGLIETDMTEELDGGLARSDPRPPARHARGGRRLRPLPRLRGRRLRHRHHADRRRRPHRLAHEGPRRTNANTASPRRTFEQASIEALAEFGAERSTTSSPRRRSRSSTSTRSTSSSSPRSSRTSTASSSTATTSKGVEDRRRRRRPGRWRSCR